MTPLPEWNVKLFGCIDRDASGLTSMMRTQISSALPAPFVSKKADTSAPVELAFTIHLSDNNFRSWLQWVTYDLNEGSLPFTMFLNWGTVQPRVRCLLMDSWQAQRLNSMNWTVNGRLQIDRANLPPFSGGVIA